MLKKINPLLLAAVLALPPTSSAFGEYEEYCLWNTGGYSAGFRIEVVKRGVSVDNAGDPISSLSFYKGAGGNSVNSTETKCVSPEQAGVQPGDGIRFYVDPLLDISNKGTRECGKHGDQTHPHEGLFLVPDGERSGRLVFKSWGGLYHPTCVVESGERMHSACAATADGMRNKGCNRWELDHNPRAYASLADAVREDRGIGRLADLTDRGYDINQADPDDGATALHATVETERLDYMRFVISRGANLNIRDGAGLTPLLHALESSAENRAEILRRLLGAGTEPNMTGAGGEFPLHLAAERGDVVSARTLLQYGAILDAMHSETGATALAVAMENNRDEMVEFLRGEGAEEIRNHGEGDALSIVAENLGVDRLLAFAEDDGDVNATNDEGMTALHLAAANNRPEYANILLRFGADPNQQDNAGRSPLMAAVEANPRYAAMVPLLLGENADPNLARADGVFPLYLAVELGRRDITDMLTILADDLDVNQRSIEGEKTALGLAEELLEEDGNPEFVRIRDSLLLYGAIR